MPRKPLLAALIASLLAGCAAVPDVRPEVGQAGAAAMGLAGGQPVTVAPDWWTAIGDPQLDRLMADALAGSPTLAEAAARLRVARAAVDRGRAGLHPQVTGLASEQQQLFSGRSVIPPPYGGSWQWVGSTEADLDWSLDLAGRQKAAVAAARASAGAAALDVAAARVVLSGSVAQAYVDLARADALAAIAGEFVRSRQSALDIAQTRKRTNLGSDFEISAAQALLAEARQAQVRAAGQRQQMVHALAALAGRGVDSYATITRPGLRLAAALPVPASLPADLLARRPDIQAAQARILAADADRREARAAFYPDVDLRAFVGTAALGLGSLFSGGALTAGAGPAIHLPIFTGGGLAAGYRGAVGEVDVAVAGYDRLVTEAVHQAADALSAVATHTEDATQQRAVVAQLERTVQLDAVRVRTGLASRLDVLDANDRLLTARQAQANIDADGAISRIQLLVALGGGFTPVSATSLAAGESRPSPWTKP
jgi:NodT family efflux transporter outer membrane factor (OMF) lipoprotein